MESDRKRKFRFDAGSQSTDDEDVCRKAAKMKDEWHPRNFSYTSDGLSNERTSSSDGETSPLVLQGMKTSFKDSDSSAEEEDSPLSQDIIMPSKAQKMMETMGYEEGKGLGRHKQGITSPIAASLQRGRRGLGFTIQGFEPVNNLKWDKSKEHIMVEEEVVWLPPNDDEPLTFDILSSWMQEGSKKKDISGETEFCHPEVLENILASKTVFDELPEKEMFKARARSNPYETIGKAFFQNRAALKMANMDAVFNFMFSNPVDENGHPSVGPDELLYFADVCAAPGGFTEYILWKRKTFSDGFCDAKGFGFTLKENDFRLHDFFAAPAEFFEPHYGSLGDGDIYVPENISSFRKFVLKCTGGKGVHFMMADGGFSVEGQENIQEILSKELYLCQFLMALGIVRTGGHFVCKLFDIFTPFSVGLLYIMYKCFRHVCIHKPNSSRPANSERYIICKWKKDNTEDCYDYLFEVNKRLRAFSISNDMDVTEVVSLEALKEDKPFYNYIYKSNCIFGERQVVSLQKIRTFCKDVDLIEDEQVNIRAECLKYWQLPERPRVAPVRMGAKEKSASLLGPQLLKMLSSPPSDVNVQNLETKIRSPYDFRFMLLSSLKDGLRERGFFLGLGGPHVFQWNGKENQRWLRCAAKFELPPDTIVYGEIVLELRGELKAQRKVTAFHMIDGLYLNGFDVTAKHVVERHAYLRKFAAALNKEGRNDLVPVRCKQLYKLEEIDAVLQHPLIQRKVMKGGTMLKRVYCESDQTKEDAARYSIPTGVFFMKITLDPWMMAYSKTNRRKYWFNTLTRDSTFDCLKDVIAPVSVTYTQGVFWWWESGVKILENEEALSDNLHLEKVICHVNKSK